MDFRRLQREHAPIHRAAVEKVNSFSFLGVHVTDNLICTTHTDDVVNKAQQCLFNLRTLKKFSLAPKTLESILYQHLVWQLQAQGSPEGVSVCPTHHRGHTTACPP